jgi:inorganic triphosphatase YgiF
MATHGTTSREVELKLAVPAGSARVVARHPLLRASQTVRRREVSNYFDTPGLALARRGVILRVRHSENRWIQTLKAEDRDSVAADRAEWEWPLIDGQPDLALLRTTPIADEVPVGLDVAPVFATEVDRTIRMLEFGGTVAEAAWDQGFIIAGECREPVDELELELREGDPAELYRLAIKLHEDLPLTIASESKAARGYRLRTGEPPGAQKARPVALPGEAAGVEIFRRIILAGLGHLVANQPAGIAGDPEGIHQMRVAVRRLRTALLLFEPHLEAHATARFEDALRRLGRTFGEARDWDVFCGQILQQPLGSASGWCGPLEQPAAARREAAHRKSTHELQEPPFTALVLGLAAWSEQGRAMPGLIGDDQLRRPIEELCPRLLDRLARKVKRRGRHIDGSDAARHALRKSLKKLRYATDYLQSLYPRKPVKYYRRACKKLLRVLGDINDAVAASALAESLASQARTDLTPSVGALATWLARRRAGGLQKLSKRWEAFRDEPKFWRR